MILRLKDWRHCGNGLPLRKETFWNRRRKGSETMARPIRETPILYGKNAERFMEAMARVDSMSEEERAANREECRKAYESLVDEVVF